MKTNKEYLVTTLAQDRVGLLSRVAMVFSRRGINIDSLQLSGTAMQGIAQISMVVRTDARTIKQVVKQIAKQVEVMQAYSNEQPEWATNLQVQKQVV
jgi:acetolactate synthase-1/3 small subunit